MHTLLHCFAGEGLLAALYLAPSRCPQTPSRVTSRSQDAKLAVRRSPIAVPAHPKHRSVQQPLSKTRSSTTAAAMLPRGRPNTAAGPRLPTLNSMAITRAAVDRVVESPLSRPSEWRVVLPLVPLAPVSAHPPLHRNPLTDDLGKKPGRK